MQQLSLSRAHLATRLAVLQIALSSTLLGAQAQKPVQSYLTSHDATHLLEAQPPLQWTAAKAEKADAGTTIIVDDKQRYQTIDGFGHTLTGGSAQLLMKMSSETRHALLQEVFGRGEQDIAVSYLRLSVGASDMNDHVYTYDDLPAGQTDPTLEHFSMTQDADVIAVLKEILVISPRIQILASPWTAPAWMKDNGAVKGGALLPSAYRTYAQYLVRYIRAMAAEGIRIDALTPQNEPENPKNTPSLVMTAEQQANFIATALGPALQQAGLHTKILTFDHNADHPIYPETVLRDPAAAHYVDGSAFHLYRGDMHALTEVHDAFPSKSVYFTEQMVVSGRNDSFPIARSVARLTIAAPRNWSRNVLLWNLAADPENGPHTSDGGCPMCAGALTLDGNSVKRLVAYYTVAQASRFVPPGSVRIDSGEKLSTSPGNGGMAAAEGSAPTTLPHVAFLTPTGRHVLLLANPGADKAMYTVKANGKMVQSTLGAGDVLTLCWQ